MSRARKAHIRHVPAAREQSRTNLMTRLLEWQDGRCSVCLQPARPEQCNKEHIFPRHPPKRWRGGPNTLNNIMASHVRCNSLKGCKQPDAAYVARLVERNARAGLPPLDMAPLLRHGRPVVAHPCATIPVVAHQPPFRAQQRLWPRLPGEVLRP